MKINAPPASAAGQPFARSLRSGLLLLLAGPAMAQETVPPTSTAFEQQAMPPAAIAFDPAAPLPVDPRVTLGTLPNGIRYYIRQNTRPEKRAELRLVVNAGSIVEEEDELGFAHMVEHMAFNGTTRFPKNELIHYLQSIGVRFGPDLNAYTGFDETVYILPVPTDSVEIVEKAFTILADWARGQTFDSAEVMAERSVVREEWRGRKGAGDRMLHQWLPVAFKGSRYASRLPIGTEPSIMAATPATLRAFYEKWYRPDLMAVVAVGDFDSAEIESRIRQHFSTIAPAHDPEPRPVFDVPDNSAPLVAVAGDREATASTVSLTFKLPAAGLRTAADFRAQLVTGLYLQMLNARFAEITDRPGAPFLGAGASKGSFFARTRDAFTLSARVEDGSVERGLEALLIEARRVDEFGFLEAELDRARQNQLRGYERAWAERETTTSGLFADEYIRHFLAEEAIPGIEHEYRLAREMLPGITLDDVNRLASRWITEDNRVIVVQAPVKPDLAAPTENGILAVFDRARAAPLAAYAEDLSTSALLDQLPLPARIVGERAIASIGAVEWTLSNRARVIVKPTDFKSDEILFASYSSGGTSLAPDEDFMSAALAPQVVALGGIGKFSRVDLSKKLSGKAVALSSTIGETIEGHNGRSSPQDLETLFQLIHLDFTEPRLDTVAFAAFSSRVAPALANRGASPEAVFSDTVQVTMTEYSVRHRPVTPAVFAEVDPLKAFDFYRDRFSDASDFTFIFVGNVDLEALKPQVERYLATLPSLGRQESYVERRSGPPKGVIQKTVRAGTEPKATALIVFSGPCEYSQENRLALRALTALVQIRLTETLREGLGGTYSPTAGGSCSFEPRPQYTVRIDFESSPDNVEALSAATFAVIDSLRQDGPSLADLGKVREQITREREVEVKQNAYWLTNIMGRDRSGEDFAGLAGGGSYDEAVKRLSVEELRRAANEYFNMENHARFVLLPEEERTGN